jgi:type IV pilus assembly protein PilW
LVSGTLLAESFDGRLWAITIGGIMRSNKKGFTTIELLISMAIMSIALGSIYSLYMSHVGFYTTETVASRVQQNVRSSINLIMQDIRMAGLDPEDSGFFGIQQITAQSIRFTADRDMDGELDDPDLSDGLDESDLEQIAYVYDGNSALEMVIYHADDTIETQDTLVDNVLNFSFTYLDANDAVTAVPEEIRTVLIQMTIQRPAGRKAPVNRTLIKRVRCRNLDY